MRVALSSLGFVLLSLAASSARAGTPEDVALAEELFRTAKEAMDQQRWSEACPKLAESQRLDPAGGTMLTLALCHEGEGRTASAWAEFGEALAFAKKDGRPNREAIAREHLDALAPRLVRLRVRVAPDPSTSTSLLVKRDGIELKRASWDVAAPVDPGPHLVEASAPGHVAFRTSVEATTEGMTYDVAVPALALEASAPGDAAPAVVAPLPPSSSKRSLRWAAYGVGGFALASLGLGVAFAIDAKSERDAANNVCPGITCGDAAAIEASRAAGRSADVATVSFVVAATAVAAAVVLFVASSEPSPRPTPASTSLR